MGDIFFAPIRASQAPRKEGWKKGVYAPGPCALCRHTFSRHLSCWDRCNHARHGHTPATSNTGQPLHVRGCGNLPTQSSPFPDKAEVRDPPLLAGPLQSSPYRNKCKACKAHQGRICPAYRKVQQRSPSMSRVETETDKASRPGSWKLTLASIFLMPPLD